MREDSINREPLTDLLRDFSGDLRTFLKQEMKLVKQEMMEKVSQFARHAVVLAVGGIMAGVGSILLLASFGFLLAFAFQTTGLNMLLAVFVGFASIGLLVAIVGGVISVKGVKAISKDSLTPERSIQTVTGDAMLPPEAKKPHVPEPPASVLHGEALATKHRIEDEQQELRHRLTPSELKKRAVGHIVKHPVSWSTAALACALTGGYFVRRKFRKS